MVLSLECGRTDTACLWFLVKKLNTGININNIVPFQMTIFIHIIPDGLVKASFLLLITIDLKSDHFYLLTAIKPHKI